jgi:hypothetical protein
MKLIPVHQHGKKFIALPAPGDLKQTLATPLIRPV